MFKYQVLLFIASLVFLFPAIAGTTQELKDISMDLPYTIEWWLQEDSTPLETGETITAFRAWRATDPDGKKVYAKNPLGSSRGPWPCDVSKVKRTFQLPKTTFLLGEPIIVEYLVELNGLDEWMEETGGCYRARGRDDNFLFLLRHENGVFVRDPYGKIEVYMGGIGGPSTVKKGEPLRRWHALQEWCNIACPGNYDVYCFKQAQGHEVIGSIQYFNDRLPQKWVNYNVNKNRRLVHKESGEETNYYIAPSMRCARWTDTPLKQFIPKEVYEQAKNHVWGVGQCEAYAHFTIRIDAGRKKAQKAMVETYTQQYDEVEYTRELQKAIWFSGNRYFLPFIEKQMEEATSQDYLPFTGLAMWNNPKALKLLLQSDNQNALASLRHLPAAQIPSAIPSMIRLLTDADHRTRALAEQNLRQWTGESFHHTWRGYHHKRPTMEEARGMKPQWRRWWGENKDTFQPKPR